MWRWLNFFLFEWSAQKWSFYTRRNKNEISSSQPCISQYCRPSKFHLVQDKEMLGWYLTVSGLTAFNQCLADQDLSGLLLIVPARGRVNFSSIKPFANSLFLLGHSFVPSYLWFLSLVVVTLTFSLLKQAFSISFFSEKILCFLSARFCLSSLN